MLKLLVLYGHLLAVCLAIGTIVLTDLRLLARITGYHVVIPPPSRFETRVVSVALLLLCLTGSLLIAFDVGDAPLANPKLQGKLVLVLVLIGNALVLHRHVFPRLERQSAVADWTSAQRWGVALSVGLSNSLWLYCAFLGVARPWNHQVSLAVVLLLALTLWAGATLGVRFALTLASRDEPEGSGDWIDSMKTTLSGVQGMGAFEHDFEPARPRAPAVGGRPLRHQPAAARRTLF